MRALAAHTGEWGAGRPPRGGCVDMATPDETPVRTVRGKGAPRRPEGRRGKARLDCHISAGFSLRAPRAPRDAQGGGGGTEDS